MHDIVIIGAGPAGLTAAIYAARADKDVVVLECSSYGGQIVPTTDIENYPAMPHVSGIDFAENLFNQAKELGAKIIFEKAINIKNRKKFKEVVTTENTYKTKTIIVATGAENRKLGLPNEDKFVGKGVSYCATCDGRFFKNKMVAVVGGGNTAIEEAIYLSDLAKKVYLIHRRDTFRADKKDITKLNTKNNIEFIYNSRVTKLKGDEKLDAIEVTDKEKNVQQLDVSAIFIAVGRVPENQNFAKVIKLNKYGYVKAKEDCHTNVEGIYAAGDNRIKDLRQLVTATSDGAIAATEAIKYINSKEKIKK